MRPLRTRSVKQKKSIWEIIAQITSTLVPVIAIFIGIWQFNLGQTKNIELEYYKARMNDSISFANKLYEKKVLVYTTISKSIANLISLSEEKKIDQKLIQEFDQMYYGEAILVEDSISCSALNDFHRVVMDYQKGMGISVFQLKQVGIGVCETLKETIKSKELK